MLYADLLGSTYWENPEQLQTQWFQRIEGMPEDLPREIGAVLLSPAGLHAQTLEPGTPFSEIVDQIPADLRANPWVVKVVTDSKQPGKRFLPEGLFSALARKPRVFVDPLKFDRIAEEIQTEIVPKRGSVAVVGFDKDGENITLRRTVDYYLGRTTTGEQVDCTVNDVPHLPGFPRSRLDRAPSIFHSHTVFSPLDRKVGDVYYTGSPNYLSKTVAATVIVSRSTKWQRPRGKGEMNPILGALPGKLRKA